MPVGVGLSPSSELPFNRLLRTITVPGVALLDQDPAVVSRGGVVLDQDRAIQDGADVYPGVREPGGPDARQTILAPPYTLIP
jgi:hypothetical protein